MTLHYLITLMNLPIGTSGTNEIQYMNYTTGYIPKLQIHQHSLLTRKVFSRHNLSAQVFFSVSSRSSSSPRHLQVIFIFKSYSSSSYLHLQVIFIFGSGSSLDLDHHCWIIMIGSSSQVLSHDSSRHRKFYRANHFSCWL